MNRRLGLVACAATVAALLLPLWAAPASAHEERNFGRWHVEVGFGDEPPYVGEKNSVQLILSDKSGKPVTDLGDTLKVAVRTGDSQPDELSLEPNFEVGGDGTLGDYRAWFIPTAPGKYTFRFTGSIKGDKVDQSFTSSPTGFDEVQDPVGVEYPAKDPTTGELAARLDREVPRLTAALESANAGQRRANHAAGQARLLAVAGLVVGVAGVAVGAAAMARRRA